MKSLLRISILFSLLLIASTARSQVLISLLFGEKLNSDKIEFGLVGGFNWSDLNGLDNTKYLSNFNLGFYFHFKVHPNSYISTGVLVKSALGATGLPTYPIDIAEFDSVFVDGKLTKKIKYFHVPILYQYRIKQIVYFEAGIQVGLRSAAQDIFTKSDFGGDVEYIRNTRKEFAPLDIGLLGGFGFKFRKKPKSMSIGLRYYHGLIDVSKVEGSSFQNSSIYLFFKVPIGVGKEKKVEVIEVIN